MRKSKSLPVISSTSRPHVQSIEDDINLYAVSCAFYLFWAQVTVIWCDKEPMPSYTSICVFCARYALILHYGFQTEATSQQESVVRSKSEAIFLHTGTDNGLPSSQQPDDLENQVSLKPQANILHVFAKLSDVLKLKVHFENHLAWRKNFAGINDLELRLQVNGANVTVKREAQEEPLLNDYEMKTKVKKTDGACDGSYLRAWLFFFITKKLKINDQVVVPFIKWLNWNIRFFIWCRAQLSNNGSQMPLLICIIP